jgi:hypothetical protein
MLLSDNQWAKNHSWMLPFLWWGGAIAAMFTILSARWFRSLYLRWSASEESSKQEGIGQETHGGHSTATAVGSIRDVGAGASVKFGGDIHYHGPVTLLRPPRVALVEYGPIPANYPPSLHVGQTGFHLANDGEDAYQVLIQPFEIESSVWAKSKESARIEARGRDFALVWLDGHSPFALDVGKWDLLGAMQRAADGRDGQLMHRPDYSVNVSVIYRDADNHWYRTTTPLRYIPSQHRFEFGSPTYEACGPIKPPDVVVPPAQPRLTPILSDEGPGNAKPVLPGFRTMYFAGIKNVQNATNVTANNVRARLAYKHADEVDAFVCDPATWLTHWPEMAASFNSSVDLASSVMERLILAGTSDNNETRAVAVEGAAAVTVFPGKLLKFGDWQVDGIIESDNCNTIRISYGFHVDEVGTLSHLRKL